VAWRRGPGWASTFSRSCSPWGPAARTSFVGLVLATQEALVIASQSLGRPIATGVLAIGLGAVAAVGIFERQEL
jgi:hypothetical protein